ncbi:hypothetical protein B566_EDAN007383, partial [Ephemera danica]
MRNVFPRSDIAEVQPVQVKEVGQPGHTGAHVHVLVMEERPTNYVVPCPDPSDFREQQCLAYNEVPYNGALLSWSPHQDDADPCALTCSTRVPGREGRTLVRVGCDLRIGSMKRVDECGVCGGDGSSCARPMFHWEETATSLCSATCGGGKYVVGEYGPCSVTCGGGTRYRPIFCAEEANGTHVKVPEHFCHGHKPRYQEQCNTADCPEWDSGEWSG